MGTTLAALRAEASGRHLSRSTQLWSVDKPQKLYFYPNHGRLPVYESPAPARALALGSMGCRVYTLLKYLLPYWGGGGTYYFAAI